MLSTHSHVFDKENHVGAAPLKTKQTQKPAALQQQPVKQQRSFGRDISQNDRNRNEGLKQTAKKDITSKVSNQRAAFSDITNRQASQQTQKPATKPPKTKVSESRPYPRIDFDAPIDQAYFPEPEMEFSDPYVERFNAVSIRKLPSLIPDFEPTFVDEIETNVSVEVFPAPLEDQLLDDTHFFQDDILPLAIEDICLESF